MRTDNLLMNSKRSASLHPALFLPRERVTRRMARFVMSDEAQIAEVYRTETHRRGKGRTGHVRKAG